MSRTCSQCGRPVASYNPGRLCFACQEKRIEELASGSKPYYDVKDMMRILGLESEEQVRRKGRAGLIPGRIPGVRGHRYLMEVVDHWVGSAGRAGPKPASPAQEDAHRRCLNGDHAWLWDEKLDGLAYRTEVTSDLRDNVVTVRYKRTCYFCNYTAEGSL